MQQSKSQKGFRILQQSSLSPLGKLSPEKSKLTLKSRKSSDLLRLMFTPKVYHKSNKSEASFQKREYTLPVGLTNSNVIEDSPIQVIVHVGQQQFRFSFPRNITTTQLRNVLQQKIKLTQKILSFITYEKNILIDYYLTLEQKPLIQDLELQPYLQESFSNIISLKDFQLIKCIGAGGFSKVYLVKWKENGQFYALKLIDKEFIIKYKKAELVQNERDIMAFINHPFAIQMLFSFETRNFVAFILEFCSGGELFFQLKVLKRMSEQQAQFYFVEICISILYLHSLGIMYRDIKPENILLDSDGHIRIADFGLSKITLQEEFAYSFCGSPEYMAPEMLLKQGHNLQVDHYCLGALLYELVTGLPPFYSKNTDQIYNSILNEEISFPNFLSPEIKDLMNGLLTKDPNVRLGNKDGVKEILQHHFFKNTQFLDILDKKIKPPQEPNLLQLNFETKSLQQGDLEVREKLIGKAGFKKDFKLFDQFYYDNRENVHINDQQRLLRDHRKMIEQISQFHQKKPKSLDRIKEKSQIGFQNKLHNRLQQQMSLRSSPLKLGNKSTLTNNFLKTEISDITCKRPI